MKKILPIEGLRAFAVLGVIWAHSWMFFDNLPLYIAGINLNQFFSIGGVGVDLFFVISGFCMYLMHAKNSDHFTLNSYADFVKKRWFRIAPAFYFVVTFECFRYLLIQGIFPGKSFLYHILFINTFNKDNVLSPPFWSLATEWHFYLILPFIFIFDPAGKRLNFRLWSLIGICMLFRLGLYHSNDLDSGHTIPSDKIWYRFVEFGFGILAARFYLDKRRLPVFLNGNLGFAIAFLISFCGRMFMTTAVFSHFGKMDFMIRALGEPVLTFGFALMLLSLISSTSIFSRIITLPPFLYIGRISYSMYLWHWLITFSVCQFVVSHRGISVINQEFAFLISVLFCIPIAALSYRYLEAPYFKKQNKTINKTGLIFTKK